MRVCDVELSESACREYAEHAGARRMSAQQLCEKLRSAAVNGEASVTVWRGERVIFLEGAYWSFEADGGRLMLTGCAAIVLGLGFRGTFRSMAMIHE